MHTALGDDCNPWGSPPVSLEPPRDEVHLWRVMLDSTPADDSCLAEDEKARASKLVQPQHRHRFIAMRSALRLILARYLQAAPGTLTFAYGEKGKPSVAGNQNDIDLRFNVSHSAGLGLVAFARGYEVGIDIETRQEVVDFMAIARRFFSLREYKSLGDVALELRQQAFLRCWTRKESYIKALGKGLACSLQSFSVSVSPEVREDVLFEHECAGEYHVGDVALPDEGFAALAVEGVKRTRCCWTYDP